MRTTSVTAPPDSRLLLQRCACCDSDPTHTPAEIARAARAHQRADEEAWEALQPLLPAMREEWALADAQADPRLWCPPEWVAEEEARRRAERRARRVERVPAQRPAPEPEPLREPAREVLEAFGLIPAPAPALEPETEPEAEEVDLDDETTQADEGPSAVLEERVSDPRTAQEQLHDADREHLAKHKAPRWRRASKVKPEAPWIADEAALPESVQTLARVTYADGRQALVGAAISLSMSALQAGWTPLQVERLLQDRHVPISILCTHREPGGSQAGRPRSPASALQHAQRIVSIAQQHLDAGLPLGESGHVPDVVREIRQVLLEHDWRGPRGRHDLAVLLWLLDRAAAVHQSVLHASARETGLAIGSSARTASRSLLSLQQRGFLSRSTETEPRQHDGEDARSYRLRVPMRADRYCLTAGQRHVSGPGARVAGSGANALIGIDPLISTTPRRSPEQWVNADQDVWVTQGAALMAWVMGHDLWTRDGLGHSAARVAWELHEHGEARTQRDLAARTGLAQSTVATALKALRRVGLAHLHSSDLLQPLTQEVLDAALVRVDEDRLPEVPTASGARQRAYALVEEQRAGRRRARHHWAGRARAERLSRVCAAFPELGWAVVDDGGVAAVMDTTSGALLPDRAVHQVAPQWHTQDVREALRAR